MLLLNEAQAFNFDSTYEELKQLGDKIAVVNWDEDFDSTYEELKHCEKYRNELKSVGNFDSTYEELKPTIRIILLECILHFDSTYEELKPELEGQGYFKIEKF